VWHGFQCQQDCAPGRSAASSWAWTRTEGTIGEQAAHQAVLPQLLAGGASCEQPLAQYGQQRLLGSPTVVRGPPRRFTGMLNEAPRPPMEIELTPKDGPSRVQVAAWMQQCANPCVQHIKPPVPQCEEEIAATGAKAPPTGCLPVGGTITRTALLISDSRPIAIADPPL
jgi:hypothetical protein